MQRHPRRNAMAESPTAQRFPGQRPIAPAARPGLHRCWRSDFGTARPALIIGAADCAPHRAAALRTGRLRSAPSGRATHRAAGLPTARLRSAPGCSRRCVAEARHPAAALPTGLLPAVGGRAANTRVGPALGQGSPRWTGARWVASAHGRRTVTGFARRMRMVIRRAHEWESAVRIGRGIPRWKSSWYPCWNPHCQRRARTSQATDERHHPQDRSTSESSVIRQ